ncbi:MAG: hypothetical protein CMG61_00855 [Candidatus Marinimicrobia bacterium]|nr:hypothetical protein [Candidatus Neomarinimicrobiota bacterium]
MIMNWNILSDQINRSKSIVLSTHINPDGDGLGSELAMFYYLKSIGKKCRIINISNHSEKYNFMDRDSNIEIYKPSDHLNWIKNCDCALIFDIGNHLRLGEISKILSKSINVKKISIDHHPSNSNFFDINFLDTTAPATGYLVWKYFKYIDLDLDLKTAEPLYAALITDTGSFRYNSTNPDSHLMAKEILETGLKPYNVFSKVYEQRTISQVKLMSSVIDSLEIFEEFASIKISSKMMSDCKAKLEDVDGFTDFVRSIKGVEVSFMISELPNDKFRINFRSRGKYVINDIAQYYGGGGHEFAAGATVNGSSFNEIEFNIIKMLKEKKDFLCQ